MIYILTQNNKVEVKIISIILSIFLCLGLSMSLLTIISRLGYNGEATATVISRQIEHDEWHITVTYTYNGKEYKESRADSHRQVGDKYSIFVNSHNPKLFYDATDNVNYASIFFCIIAAIWFGICGIIDVSFYVFHKKLLT